MLITSTKYLHRNSRLVFAQMAGHHSLPKLTHTVILIIIYSALCHPVLDLLNFVKICLLPLMSLSHPFHCYVPPSFSIILLASRETIACIHSIVFYKKKTQFICYREPDCSCKCLSYALVCQ
uniref:Uncharacterized protein n=1 Tax=Pipistrellus kuhlii TaxID=59472 RepID=A0A7J7YXX9_PIPKU|nr:hypothetical protein mPipKuh1_009898 [Pipistrellus kuhlii]